MPHRFFMQLWGNAKAIAATGNHEVILFPDARIALENAMQF
jgi:hypothetical protein